MERRSQSYNNTMVHRDSHRGNGEVSTGDKTMEKKGAIHSNHFVIGHHDDCDGFTMAKRRRQDGGSFDEDRDNLIKLSITECSTSSGDERDGPSPREEASSPSPTAKKPSILWTLARMLFLDAPLFLILITFMCVSWIHYVHDSYLVKQLEAATWTFDRDTTDATYYYRYCDEQDLTTTNPLDLYLADDATSDDAYEHQLKHGFTVFPGVLSEETCTNLRNYVVDKNHKLTEEESIWLISWKKRWSFGLEMEEPSVSAAVMELTSNERLKASMEKILGPNPALIELTSITSAYGAEGQHFHHDGRTNLAQYGRSVAHSYSIFIMLQNTTREMGATGACPGTHYCAEADELCETHGVQPANGDGHWAAGDALVMNMDGWHRGSAHTDPDGLDRVMICMTFTSRPRERAESRFLPQGISYSLSWDLWGHTWNDLEHADQLRQPWTTLRALGLYKKPSAEYGIDYVSSATQRMANEWFGFMGEDLEAFVRFGGFKFLPQWLQGERKDETTWHEFLLDTLLRCEDFIKSVSKFSAGLYILLCSATGLLFSGGIRGGSRRFGSAMLRLAIMCGTVFALYKAAVKRVDSTQWASDLRQGLRYTSPFGTDVSEYDGPLTTPYRNDVLIETRYKSEYLAMYNDFIGGFPGNRVWNELVDDKGSLYASYSGLPPAFREAVPEYIVSAVEENSGRLLYQTWQSHWAELSRQDSIKHAKLELHVKSNSILRNVMKELEFLISEAKYGPLRKTVMMEKDIFPFLYLLKDQLMGVSENDKKTTVTTVRPGYSSTLRSRHFVPSASLSKPQTTAKLSPRRPVNLHVGEAPGEPEPDAWLRGGDVVDVKRHEQGRWGLFKATLTHALSSGICFVRLHVDDTLDQVECKQEMARYHPPSAGDRVDVLIDDQYYSGMIVKDKGDAIYDVNVSGRLFENVSDDFFRRSLNARRG